MSPEAGGSFRGVRQEDDKEMVGGGEDVAGYLAAAVGADQRRLVVGAVVHRHRVVARRVCQRVFQLKTLETQQNVLTTRQQSASSSLRLS